MTCVGMDGQMRQAVQDIVKVPVILASSLLGRLVGQRGWWRRPGRSGNVWARQLRNFRSGSTL